MIKILIVFMMTTIFSVAMEKIYFDNCLARINKHKWDNFFYIYVDQRVYTYSVIWKCGDAKKVEKTISEKEIKAKVIKFCKDVLGDDFVKSESATIFTDVLRGVEVYFVRLDVENQSEMIGVLLSSPHVYVPVNKDGEIICELKQQLRITRISHSNK